MSVWYRCKIGKLWIKHIETSSYCLSTNLISELKLSCDEDDGQDFDEKDLDKLEEILADTLEIKDFEIEVKKYGDTE